MTNHHDISGYKIFSRGELGRAHAAAHQALDAGDYQAGHRQLGQWLGTRSEQEYAEQSSDWVHLQWHMLVFELAVQQWDAAYARFNEHILPGRAVAATDAPAALWRLALTAPHSVDLPWNIVKAGAVSRLGTSRDPYIKLHDLLALAGAGDTQLLDKWFCSYNPTTETDRLLVDFAKAMRCFSEGQYARATRKLERVLPDLSRLGGSRAQNELFTEIYREALRRSPANDFELAPESVVGF